MKPFFLSLGSNLGDRLQYIEKAIRRLHGHSKIQITDLSSVYETEPVGYTDQPAFLNAVIAGKTSLTPKELLHVILEVEKALGRIREVRWGPRTIDLDILLYGTESWNEEDLQIPHPRMLERAFVLIPLAELDANYPIPTGLTYTTPLEQLKKVGEKNGVRKWKERVWEIEFGHSVN
ncbi:2-amino-4-hydroxy-6-hydroxymethyldihydropteridine diphosphokinase [Ammoniphilus resinae]|uniref:2-amino-4-hydroxy-6-hydroxymethyldihydropteridine diphosphokinase n=1 Tax=Ammoniphilus resinae TaxID=861532 RepID=A0ABS4GQG7_9BACL|nr:2-amino-4-hydroxy-6-hydroxymethyldihydropteridine diphosphokinase [Ammoniphilus resinae]MBP1932496.1 2-amino-4-hydroxy-6-hydroxymethyldihydropteridine diphosphokinase [Ammoniphilus resinae]